MITEINSNILDNGMLLEVSVPGNWDLGTSCFAVQASHILTWSYNY